jgi:hypothetical protein
MRRIAALVVAAAGLALLAAACGGSGSTVAQLGPTATGTTASASAAGGAVAFSRCMRTNGVVNYPDPASGGGIPKESLQQLGVSSARFQSAQSACRHLLPGGGRAPSQAQRQQVRALGLQFARCMRAHGVPNMPDPDSTGRIPDPASVHIDQGSPKFRAANDACGKYRPPYMPSNAQYDTWLSQQASGGG